jgi:hypothetical protein
MDPGGELAHVVKTRRARHAEAPLVLEHREALVYALRQAAELEHLVMCGYLYAAFSLKGPDEGLTADQLTAVRGWRKVIMEIATQEMLHLALVQNLLTAVGASPHLTRRNFPQPTRKFPGGIQFALLPFGEQALRHFIFLERPEGLEMDDAEGFAALGKAMPLMEPDDLVPRAQEFATIGHLYRAVEEGLDHLAAKLGPERLFVGPPRAQATETHFRWPELVAVTDLASAHRAIDTIVEQGEGVRGEWRGAHFGRLVAVLDEFMALREAEPAFEPARPVVAARVRRPESGVEVPLIGDRLTARVADLMNVGYEVLLQVLYRYFAHTEERDEQLAILADVAVGLMFGVVKPLGQLVTTLPLGPDHPGCTTGPGFELFYTADYLLPHQRAAWVLMEERLRDAAAFAAHVAEEAEPALTAKLTPVGASLTRFAESIAAGAG